MMPPASLGGAGAPVGGGGVRGYVCAILTSVTVSGRCASLKPSGVLSVSRMGRGEFCRSVLAFWLEV